MSGDRRSELRVDHRFLRPDVPGFWPSNGLVGISLISLDIVQDRVQVYVNRARKMVKDVLYIIIRLNMDIDMYWCRPGCKYTCAHCIWQGDRKGCCSLLCVGVDPNPQHALPHLEWADPGKALPTYPWRTTRGNFNLLVCSTCLLAPKRVGGRPHRPISAWW